MQLAKQSTAANILAGPILDSTGAEYTSAVIGDLSISKHDATTLTALASAATLTHIANGVYSLVLTTGNTDTLGRCKIVCTKSTYQMPPIEMEIVPTTVYDAIITNATNTTGGLPAATAAISAMAGYVGSSGAAVNGTNANTLAGHDPGATLASTTNITAAAGIAVSSIATDAITAASVKADAVTKIQSGLSTYAGADTSGTTTLLGRITSSRAGYLDNLNVGGNVASQADVQAINQSASKHLTLATVGQYERPESGTVTYTVELRTYAAATGAAVNADTTPTLTATGSITGSLSANLSVASNPATGVYRWTYTVTNTDAVEQVRFDVSATISSSTFTLSAYTQVCDLVSATWTSTDASHLTAVYDKLPTNDIADETLVLAAIAGIPDATRDVSNSNPAAGSWGESSRNSDAKAAVLIDTIGAPANVTVSADIAAVASDIAALQSHGDSAWATATGFAATGDEMALVDGAITDAKITTPADIPGHATTILGMILQTFKRFLGVAKRDRGAGTLTELLDDGTTVRTTQTLTTVGNVDTQSKAI